MPYWSLSRYLKVKVKRAVSRVGDFEAAVAREAKRGGAQGVVCGHIHHAELRDRLRAADGCGQSRQKHRARATVLSALRQAWAVLARRASRKPTANKAAGSCCA